MFGDVACRNWMQFCVARTLLLIDGDLIGVGDANVCPQNGRMGNDVVGLASQLSVEKERIVLTLVAANKNTYVSRFPSTIKVS